MKHFIELETEITDFIISEKIQFEDEFDPEIFTIVKEFIHVVATARTCIKNMESDSFGTDVKIQVFARCSRRKVFRLSTF